MCGITGFLDTRCDTPAERLDSVVRAMASTLRHRGPDDDGSWVDAAAGLALGFRRLAVIDVSPRGHQPMLSADARFVLVFNGEIYNHTALRAELQAAGERFRGSSDTEVLLAAIVRWGVAPAISRANGMFAFAVWDRAERVLTLGRDRLGEKPLYYGWTASAFVFGSELKALRGHPSFRGEVDRDALTLFFRHNYVPAPYSIYRGIRKLPPGTLLRIDGHDRDARPLPTSYWSARDVAESGVRHAATVPRPSANEAVDELEALLRDSVAMRMVADVPLGAFLSGGIDSSTVVALMQARSTRPVRTFTIGFTEAGYDEAGAAKRVAAHLGTDHTELYLSPAEAQAVIPRLAHSYDEPFADSSQIPTLLVAELARRDVTVSLSGDGGDELFGGYTRYALHDRVWRTIGRVPPRLRHALGAGVLRVPPPSWDRVAGAAGRVVPAIRRISRPGDKARRLGGLLLIDRAELAYRDLVSVVPDPAALVLGGAEPRTTLADPATWADLPDVRASMMYLDTVTYLPDDILAKVDRATMAVSLEARVPLLDHRVVEFAWRLPGDLKVRGHETKWVLRQVLARHLPIHLVDRPKMGFGVPIGDWLRGALRPWADDLLSTGSLDAGGFLDSGLVQRRWQEHLSGRRDWREHLWAVLMFQTWLASTTGEGHAAARLATR